MTVSAEQKRAAADKLDKAEGVAHSSVPVAGGLALIPPHGPFIALGAGFIGAGFMVYAISMRRIIRDPPDANFRVPAELRESKEGQAMGLGESPILHWAGELRGAIERAAAHADAFITSVERAMGARDSGEAPFVRSRLGEAAEFASGLADEVARSAELCEAIPDELMEMTDREPTLADQLPPETLASLFRAGVPYDYVFTPHTSWFPPVVTSSGSKKFEIWGDDTPTRHFVDRLLDWTAAGFEYAGLLRGAIAAGSLWDDEELRGASGPLPTS